MRRTKMRRTKAPYAGKDKLPDPDYGKGARKPDPRRNHPKRRAVTLPVIKALAKPL